MDEKPDPIQVTAGDLPQTDINGHAEPLEWARIIREHLQATGGWGAPQRQFADPGSIPSLRH